ncbi:MAG: AarF/ABC1/UbiB kinase family protein [Bdellovibrionales bacterium]
MSKKLKKITSAGFERSFKLASWTAKTGAKWAGNKIKQSFADQIRKNELLEEFLIAQLESLTKEMGQLKGSVMKAGQMLSVYGEHFLPEKANEFLKTLQFQSPPLEYSVIEKQLKRELADKLDELEIDPEPFAAASLGQVHIAHVKETGEKLALKVQYPEVDKAIDADIRFLRKLLKTFGTISPNYDADVVIAEIKTMLHQEVDYIQEAQQTEEYRKYFSDNERLVIPTVNRKFSTKKVLATEFIDSVPFDDPKVLQLPQDDRNKLGRIFLDYYYNELFVWGRVQTDPHFGNFRIQLSEGKSKIVLLDFGAVKILEDHFKFPYKQMIKSAFFKQRSDFFAAAEKLGFILPDDAAEHKEYFYEFCQVMVEPFSEKYEKTGFDYKNSDLPQKVFTMGKEMVTRFKFRTPSAVSFFG